MSVRLLIRRLSRDSLYWKLSSLPYSQASVISTTNSTAASKPAFIPLFYAANCSPSAMPFLSESLLPMPFDVLSLH